MAELNFNEIIDKAKELAQTAGEKTQEFYQISKLKIEIAELKMKKDKAFNAIGKKLYDSVKAGEDLPDFAALIEEIDLLGADIDEKQEIISTIRNTVRCANCGAELSEDDPFCSKCGASVK